MPTPNNKVSKIQIHYTDDAGKNVVLNINLQGTPNALYTTAVIIDPDFANNLIGLMGMGKTASPPPNNLVIVPEASGEDDAKADKEKGKDKNPRAGAGPECCYLVNNAWYCY